MVYVLVSHCQIVKQAFKEQEPEVEVSGIALLHDTVKCSLGGAFDGVPVIKRGRVASFFEGFEDVVAVGEEQGVADVEEDGLGRCGHALLCWHSEAEDG